ncbi:hypothetical protein O181_008785 [Austropuccinia psidii MF-1]|uniref:Uncharacterized protein n=1 Tax=Austropuccinia psidii MF-1 TaxID=1389203 RepID=A0A9Q3BQ14_9BASI|nr:hypothetical protein [Austropuccinia psidii MF-1]
MIVRALVANGVKRVYIVARRLETLEATAKEFAEGRGQVLPIQADVTDKSSIKELKDHLESKEKYIDILVNNAGISGPGFDSSSNTVESIAQSMWSASEEGADEVLKTNILGYFFTSAALLPLLGRSQNNPQIINISSNASFGRRTMAGMLYSMTKASINHFTKLLATQLSPTKIRCNAIAPGLYPSELTSGESDEKNLSSLQNTLGIEVPAGRPGRDKEMAAAILFLASKNQIYTSGSVILTDGGVLNLMPSSY